MSTASTQYPASPQNPRSARGADTQDADQGSGNPRERRSFGDVMGEIFLPMLPALIGSGILQGITSLLTAFGWLTPGSSFDTVLATLSSAVFYFLPFLLAVTTARAFSSSPYLAIGTVAFFLHPDMVAAMAGSQQLALFGIPVVKTTYTSAVIPIILMIWGMSYVERLVHRVVPSALSTVLVPPLVLLFTAVLGLLVLGPIGKALTDTVAWVVRGVDGSVPWLVPVLVGACGALMASVGLSFALFPIALLSLTTRGFDGVYGPGMLASNMALAGMALAVGLKAESKDYRAFSLSAGATALLGVVQPALYGCGLTLKRPLAAVMLGGASGGLVAGLTGFHVYAMMPAGLSAIPVWMGGDGWRNPLSGAAVVVTALVVSFLAAWFLGYEQPDRETVNELSS